MQRMPIAGSMKKRKAAAFLFFAFRDDVTVPTCLALTSSKRSTSFSLSEVVNVSMPFANSTVYQSARYNSDDFCNQPDSLESCCFYRHLPCASEVIV